MKGYMRKQGANQGWQLCIYPGGKNANGKPNRHFETFRGTKVQAEARLREILTSMDKGTYALPTRLTVKEILNQWLEGYCKTNCSMRTCDGYEAVTRLHLVPSLGHILVKDLRPSDIDRCYGIMCETLTNRTVLHVHRVLSQALRWAVWQDYVGNNPCERVKPPKVRNKAMHYLQAFEVSTLLDGCQDSSIYPIVYTGVSSGLRQSELLGLRWRDVDLDLLAIHVCQVLYKRKGILIFKEPKTEHSRRQVAMTPKLAAFLRDYRAERESLYWHLGRPLGLNDLVFAGDDGRPIDPSTLTHKFAIIVKRAGLDIVFHDLRHSYATLMLAANVHPKIVQEGLGHSSIAITLDLYSHVIPGLQDAAAKTLDAMLPVGVVERGESVIDGGGGEIQI